MKYISYFLFALFFIFMQIPFCAQAQNAQNKTKTSVVAKKRATVHSKIPKTITVLGIGSVNTIPTEGSFSIGIQTESKKIKEAQQDNNKKMKVIHDILEQYKIPKTSLQTINYSISPVYDYEKGKTEWRGYSVNNKLSVKVADITKLPAMIDELSEFATYVQDISFTNKDIKEQEEKAMTMAIKDARAKADFIANNVGMVVKSIMKIDDMTDMPTYNSKPFMAKSVLADSAPPTILQGGTISIDAEIKIVFILE